VARAAESRKLPPEVLTEDEAKALIRACSRRGSAGIRNAALIAVLWRTGLRLGEALALMPERDVNLDLGEVYVRHGKGDRDRTTGLDLTAVTLVQRWKDRRELLGLHELHPLFCTLNGGWLDQSYVRHALARLRKRAGIQHRVHAHGLRHTYAAELAREGTPTIKVRDLLGHQSIATTDRYLGRIAPHELVQLNRSRTWKL
jgi:site-specific recombinase XerD